MTRSQFWDSGGSELLLLQSWKWLLSTVKPRGSALAVTGTDGPHSHFHGLLSSLCLMRQSGGARLRVHEVGGDTGDPSLENPSVSKRAQAPPSWAAPSSWWSETQPRSLPCKEALQRGVWKPSREQIYLKQWRWWWWRWWQWWWLLMFLELLPSRRYSKSPVCAVSFLPMQQPQSARSPPFTGRRWSPGKLTDSSWITCTESRRAKALMWV